MLSVRQPYHVTPLNRKTKTYLPPRFMTASQAAKQIIESAEQLDMREGEKQTVVGYGWRRWLLSSNQWEDIVCWRGTDWLVRWKVRHLQFTPNGRWSRSGSSFTFLGHCGTFASVGDGLSQIAHDRIRLCSTRWREQSFIEVSMRRAFCVAVVSVVIWFCSTRILIRFRWSRETTNSSFIICCTSHNGIGVSTHHACSDI
jgi:hypothetical protein